MMINTDRSSLYESTKRSMTRLEMSKNELDNKRTSMNIIHIVDVVDDCDDIDDEDMTKRKDKHIEVSNKKYSKYKDILIKSVRGSAIKVGSSCEDAYDDTNIRKIYENARRRNLVAEPIPMKKDKIDHIDHISDKDRVVQYLHNMVDDTDELDKYISSINNLMFSDIPAICGMHHYVRSNRQKNRLVNYIKATIPDMNRYNDNDILEISNHIDTVVYNDRHILYRPNDTIDRLFIVYKGVVEEKRGRTTIEWFENTLFRIDYMEGTSLPVSASTFTVRCDDCVLLMIDIDKILDIFDRSIKQKMIVMQDVLIRHVLCAHIDIHTIYSILNRGIRISRNSGDSITVCNV